MTQIDKMMNWLYLCPYILPCEMYTDTTLTYPANAGLYPHKQKILKEKKDILGNRRTVFQETYLLRCVLPEGQEAAKRLQQIRNWVFTQSIQGITPGLGEKESVQAEDGRLERAIQVGMGLYVLTLTVQFEKENKGE